MKQCTEKQIAEAIEKRCKVDLATFEHAGIPRRVLVPILVLTVTRSVETSEKTKRELRHRRNQADKLAKRLSEVAHDARAFAGYSAHLKFLEESMRKNASDLGKLLSRQGRRGPDLADQGMGILKSAFRDKTFNREALSRVVVEAFLAVGISAKDTKHITGDMFRKAENRPGPIGTVKGDK